MKPRKGKVLIDVFARGHAGDAVQPVLDFLIGLKADQRLMPTLAQGHIPFRNFNVPGVNRMRENIGDALIGDEAARILWKRALTF